MRKHLSIAGLTFLFAGVLVAQSEQDRKFADAMIMHHQDGIKMAQMAIEKALNAELRSMARKMIDDQQSEIQRMQSLRGAGPQTPMEEIHQMPGMMPMSEMQKDMEMLQSARGREFDATFAKTMAKHHEGAIRMANDEVQNGSLAGMKEIAQGLATKQTEERERLMAMHEGMEDGDRSIRKMTAKE